MRSSFPLLVVGLLNILAGAREVRVVRSEYALADLAHTPQNAPVSANGDQKLWGSGHMKGRWKQWIRREDPSSTVSKVSAASTATGAQGTSASQTTNDGAKTTTDEVSSTMEASNSATAISTSNESSVSSTASSTGISTEASTGASSTTSGSTSTDPGASCYSTTTKTSTSCETTGDSTTSCTTIKVTSSTCSPGLLCATQTSAGTTVCMEAQNEVGTAGIVIACVFSGAILACVCTMITMCYAEKRKKRMQEELRLAKSLKIAERERLIGE